MDLLTTGGAGCAAAAHCPGQSEAAYRTEFALWALTQSPLLVATDVRNLTTPMASLMLNRELLDVHQNTATPPGRLLGAWRCIEPLKCSVWGRALSVDGAEWLVALVNLGSRAHAISAAWSELGWPEALVASVRDVIEQRPMPNATGVLSLEVAPQDTRLLRLMCIANE